jgi:hypothetical protein
VSGGFDTRRQSAFQILTRDIGKVNRNKEIWLTIYFWMPPPPAADLVSRLVVSRASAAATCSSSASAQVSLACQ